MRVSYSISVQTTADGRQSWSVWKEVSPTRGSIKFGEGQEVELSLALAQASLAVLRDKQARN